MRKLLVILVLLATQSALATSPPGLASHGVILQYHHVANDTPAITSISPARFADQLDWLAQHGFEVWPLERLVNHVREGKPTPSHVVAITFDDAYVSIYDNAFPLLKQRGWPFTIFVSTKYVGTHPREYLSWNQLEDMMIEGATVANHSYDHPHLLRREAGESREVWQNRITGEIERAQQTLAKELGKTPKFFAYPYGEYDKDVTAIIHHLGYTGFGQQSGAIGPDSDFDVLPRFPMGGQYSEMDTFETKAQTLPLPIKEVKQSPLVDGNPQPSLVLTFTDTNLRLDQLVCYGPGGTTELTRLRENRFIARSKTPIPVGRSRYNCTMPVKDSERFYWFSQMWIRKNPDGSWYPEP